MDADTIRSIAVDSRDPNTHLLAEIAAQLAELNDHLRRVSSDPDSIRPVMQVAIRGSVGVTEALCGRPTIPRS